MKEMVVLTEQYFIILTKNLNRSVMGLPSSCSGSFGILSLFRFIYLLNYSVSISAKCKSISPCFLINSTNRSVSSESLAASKKRLVFVSSGLRAIAE